MRQLALGVLQMSAVVGKPLDFKSSFTTNLEAHIRRTSNNTNFDASKLFVCPADKGAAASYSFNENLEGMTIQDLTRLGNSGRYRLCYTKEKTDDSTSVTMDVRR
jgi:hypothetical protein